MNDCNQPTTPAMAYTTIAGAYWRSMLSCIMVALALTAGFSNTYGSVLMTPPNSSQNSPRNAAPIPARHYTSVVAEQDSTTKPQKAFPNTGVRYEGGDTIKTVAKDDSLRIYLETRIEAGKIPFSTLMIITEGGRVNFRWRTPSEAVAVKEQLLTIQLTKKEWKSLLALHNQSKQAFDAIDIGDVLFAVSKQTIYVEKGSYSRAISYLLEPKLAPYPKMYDDYIRRQFQIDEQSPLWKFVQAVRKINDRFQVK
jgi:hypothetical protein